MTYRSSLTKEHRVFTNPQPNSDPGRSVMNTESTVTETVVRTYLQAFLEQKGITAILNGCGSSEGSCCLWDGVVVVARCVYAFSFSREVVVPVGVEVAVAV